ncbi:hypothetical protein D3C75_1367720 [compost metagenome]
MAIEGSERGSTILMRMPRSEHPSIAADSSRLSGREVKKVFRIIKLNTLMAPGKTKLHTVSIMPRFLTRI